MDPSTIRAWSIHSCMSEGSERLLLNRFRTEVKRYIPNSLKEASCDDADLINSAMDIKENVRDRSLGKTVKF